MLKWFMLTFPIYLFSNKISKEIIFFWGGGYPSFEPLKCEASRKWPPMTKYNPLFFSAEFYSTIKMGGLEKTYLNIIKFDWTIAILSFNFFYRILYIILRNFSHQKIAISRAFYMVPSKKNFYIIADVTL